MLIVEGPDMVGKTTLCKALMERLNRGENEYRRWSYGHLGLLPPGWDYFWSYVPLANRWVVQDRFFLSEIVYGTVTRGYTHIDPETSRLLEAKLTLVGAYTAVITADEAVLRSQWESHKHREEFSLEKVLEVNAAYQDVERKFPKHRIEPDVSYHIKLGDLWPSMNRQLCDVIVNEYVARQNRLTMHAHLRQSVGNLSHV